MLKIRFRFEFGFGFGFELGFKFKFQLSFIVSTSKQVSSIQRDSNSPIVNSTLVDDSVGSIAIVFDSIAILRKHNSK